METMILFIIFLLLLATMAVFCGLTIRRMETEKEQLIQKMKDDKIEFLAKISYDINTPMNVIIGMTALGMEEVDQPERVQECLEKIHMASNFLMEKVGDRVDVSKIENGRFVLHPKSYALKDFLIKIRARMEQECKDRGVAFDMQPEEMNMNVLVDPLRFEQLFLNLLNNAAKFTPWGGRVVFRICNYATHNNVFSADYIVEDNGIGMSSEFQEMLFQPFVKETRSVAEKQDGAGLGLAIVRNIVDLMGGTITVESELGKGTCVKIHLDIELADIQPEQSNRWVEAEYIRKALREKRVLLMERQPMNLEVSRHLLQKQGMDVVSVESGEKAIETFLSSAPYTFHVILMDIKNSDTEGLTAAKRMRKAKREDAQTIPMIAMTSGNALETVYACKEAGMNATIAKPIEPRRLYQTIYEYIDSES